MWGKKFKRDTGISYPPSFCQNDWRFGPNPPTKPADWGLIPLPPIPLPWDWSWFLVFSSRRVRKTADGRRSVQPPQAFATLAEQFSSTTNGHE